jgi:hypothetical protein
MALTPTDPLDRAVAAARAEEPEDWATVSKGIRRRVRATVLPSRPIVVVAPDGTLDQDVHGSRTYLSSRVVRTRLRQVLGSLPGATAERIDLDIDGEDRLIRVEVDLVCAYGTVLPALAELARQQTARVVADLLGDGCRPPVDVTVSDVVPGDPRRT